jgi:phage tail sheath protein FI
MTNQDAYKFNVLAVPGLYYSSYSSTLTTIINNTQNRGDNILVTDLVPYGSSVSTATSQAGNLNTSYAATYWPWVQIVEPDSGQLVWVPASTVIPGVYAYNDTVSEPWFAPAGINRGGLNLVVKAENKLTQTQRDNLYTGAVNPIATFPANGVVVYGQKTLQKKASALDRVNVRRLLIALKNYISEVAQNLVFEQNTIATRNSFLAAVNPYLETVQQKQGLYAFKVIMDDSNNTADVVDRNQMIGQIYIQPTKTAEFIYLDFNILPTGATFPG